MHGMKTIQPRRCPHTLLSMFSSGLAISAWPVLIFGTSTCTPLFVKRAPEFRGLDRGCCGAALLCIGVSALFSSHILIWIVAETCTPIFKTKEDGRVVI
ncbi:hypothetical protein JB92DRAFT_2860708 [Gautieria morchelliformis]|nr:hypothetical protein JB92DRAFT_2860708 [Gautieria morchelliformis]